MNYAKMFQQIKDKLPNEFSWDQLSLEAKDKLIYSLLTPDIVNYQNNGINYELLLKIFAKAYEMILNKKFYYLFYRLNFPYQQLMDIVDTAIKYAENIAFE
jgi:hypothetical protein